MESFKIVLLLAAAALLFSSVQAAPFNGGGNDGDTPPTKPANTTTPPPLPQSNQDRNDGDSPTNTSTTTTTAAPETAVRSSAEVTKTAAQEVGTAANSLAAFIIEHFLTEELVQMSPCFAAMRSAQELDGVIRPGINYLQRIVTDKHVLGLFGEYMHNVTAFYNASINENPTCDYCIMFSELKTLTAALNTHLEDLITKAHSNGLQEDEEDVPQQQTLEEHCRVPCFDNQASIYRHYGIFTLYYVVTDIDGFVEQNFDSDKDKQ